MVKLDIFVVDNCWSCDEAHRIAAAAKLRFADEIEVTLHDLERDPHPPKVFAAPTYLLDGSVISLGNPRPEELWVRLAQHVRESRR